MSGHDNFDFGQDQQLNPPSPYQTWDEYFDLTNNDAGMISGSMEINAENNNGIPPNTPVQEGPTFDGTALNGPGSVNHDAIPSQFTDQPMFASPPAHTFGAEPMSNAPLVSADQPTTLPAQALYGPPVSGFDPVNQGVNPYHVMSPNNNPTWSQTGARLYQQYPPTTIQSGYPVPPHAQQWSGTEHTQFQQAGQALAGADVFNSHNNFQPNTAGNHFFAHQPQGGSTNVSHAFSHPAAAPAWKTLAPRPAFDAQATALMTREEPIHDVKHVSPPVAPKKKETKAEQTGKRKKPTTSNAKKTAVKKPIDSSQLLISTLDEAKTIAIKRFELEVVDDDRDEVAAHPEFWVLKIVEALEVDYKTEAEDHERLTEEARAEFTRWQTEHENKTWAVLSAKKKSMSKFAQSCAMVPYERVLEAHQLGLEDPGKAVSNGGANITMKCSERINAAITAIEEYSIVKYDLLRLDRLEGLIASPNGFTKRKVENCLVNFKKKKPLTPIWRSAPETKSGGKRKCKEPSPPSDDEDEEDDQFEGQSDEEFEQPAKRTKPR